MSNDLSPESQPWRREVERSNAETANTIASIKTNTVAQQRATQAVLSSVAARNLDLAKAGQSIRKYNSDASATQIGVFTPTAGEWRSLAKGVLRAPVGYGSTVQFLAVASLLVSFSANGQPNRLRVLVNGVASPGIVVGGFVGFNFSSVAFSGTLAASPRLDVEVQGMFNNTMISQSNTPEYYNTARYNIVGAWS